MSVVYGYQPYPVASPSDLSDLEATVEVGVGDLDGYTQQLNDIISLLLFSLFALGVISGLVFAKIMWGRIKL